MSSQITPFFISKHKNIWYEHSEAQGIMHSKTIIQEGHLKYNDLHSLSIPCYFYLYKDHLIRIQNLEEFKKDKHLAVKNSTVLPITLATIHMFEFDKQEIHHGIQITLQQDSFFLEAETQDQMLLWFEKLKLVAIQNYFDDNYRIQKEIGSGAFATVYEGTRIADKEKFAIKVFHKENINKNPKKDLYKKAIGKEMLVQRLIDDSITTRLYEVYESQEKVFLIMEYLQGGELFDRIIEKGNYTEKNACIILRQLLLGLQNMHQRKIIHRDIKPENLIFKDKESYDIRIVDFGLSEFVQDPDQLYKRSGTPGYVAPEILANKPYDTKSDIFAAGVITYLLQLFKFRLTGCTPFFGANTEEIVEKNQNAEVCYDFQEIGIKVSTDGILNYQAIDLLKNMLAKNPSSRYSVQQCLDHQWIKKNVTEGDPLLMSPQKKGLEKNVVQRNLMNLKKKKDDVLSKICGKNPNIDQFNCPSPQMKASYKLIQDSPEYKKEKTLLKEFLSVNNLFQYNQSHSNSDKKTNESSPSNVKNGQEQKKTYFMQLFKCE